MDDLRVPPGPGSPRGLRVPAGELVEQFSRASGPGGQSVNTADSRVQLSLNLGTTTALSEVQRQLAIDRLSEKLSGTGVLTISASEHRSQRRNRTAARQRLAAILRDAVTPPVVRRPTRPTSGSRRRRLEGKRLRSETKRNRRRPGTERASWLAPSFASRLALSMRIDVVSPSRSNVDLSVTPVSSRAWAKSSPSMVTMVLMMTSLQHANQHRKVLKSMLKEMPACHSAFRGTMADSGTRLHVEAEFHHIAAGRAILFSA